MKKLIAVAGFSAAIATSLLGAGTANATGSDAQYDACVRANSDLYSQSGRSMSVYGRDIAGHISSGLRDPLQERNWVYRNTGRDIDWIDSNVLVNCATDVYLGYM